MNDIVSHLLALVAGTLVGGLSKFLQDAYNRRAETAAIAAALEAELSVSLEGIREGHYVEMCDRIVAHVSLPGHTVTPDDYFDIALSETPCPLFNAHLSQMGLLGEATGPVVKAFQLYEGVCLDLGFLRERHDRLPLTVKQLVEFHESLKARFREVLKSGDFAIRQLQRQQLWWRQFRHAR